MRLLFFLALSIGVNGWPFVEPKVQQMPHGLQPFPPGFPGAFPFGAPVIVVEHHRGFNPWEDLHKNMERVVRTQAGEPRALQPVQMRMQLGGLLDMFGDHHAGHHGLAQGSFEVQDDHQERVLITATLPGYELGAKTSEKPLSVRAVGRSLVISGTHRQGPLISQWQRVFSLPKGCDMKNVSVTYNSGSGNLTVVVPRGNVTVPADEEINDDEDMMGLPPALRALRSGLPGLMDQMSGMQASPQGFLRASRPMSLENVLGQVMGELHQMHPRNQLPAVSQVPEDAIVNLVGCFAESQLEQVRLKYYGESNAANFAAMYWHAQNDHVQYFAMARHAVPLGHGFTAAGFLHPNEVPKWGVYDGCGLPCQDDDERWCGCSNEATRGFPNRACAEGEKRFAVYKIGVQNTSAASAETSANTSSDATDATAKTANASQPASGQPGQAAQPSPYWKLSEGEGEPSIEVVIPKGTKATASGNEVLVFNASKETGDDSKSPEEAEMVSSTDAPISKVKLPVGVSTDSCEQKQEGKDGGVVLKCKLEQEDVHDVPIKVIDEL